jgi:hypothetical protein
MDASTIITDITYDSSSSDDGSDSGKNGASRLNMENAESDFSMMRGITDRKQTVKKLLIKSQGKIRYLMLQFKREMHICQWIYENKYVFFNCGNLT